MVVFITSVRHPLNSKDFSTVEKLLAQTLASVCGQTDPEFRVIVVCNTVPSLATSDPRVIYHAVDFAPPSKAKGSGVDLHAALVDKGTKLLAGLLLAKQLFDPEYVMFFDADDLVSRRIARFANTHPGHDGWYIDRGYALNLLNGRIQRKAGLVRYCGTTLLYSVRMLLEIGKVEHTLTPASSKEAILQQVGFQAVRWFFGEHRYAIRYAHNAGYRLSRLPFAGCAWVLETGENHSDTRGPAIGIPCTPDFCAEFGFQPPKVAADIDFRTRWLERFSYLRSCSGFRIAQLRGFPSHPVQE